ncbi:hypothetical protein N9996_02480 [Synechococcus sp. AH-603-M21]|nr:hypothetical protein [Synechococcus sp. AH-603-M21]
MYTIFTTQRSGKTWICSLLKGNGFNQPEEYLNQAFRNVQPYEQKLKNSVVDFLDYVKTNHGGLVLQRNQIVRLCNKFKLKENDFCQLLNERFGDSPNFLLYRKSLIDHLVSNYIHQKSGYAHSTNPDTTSRESISFTYDEVKDLLDKIVQQRHRLIKTAGEIYGTKNIIYYEKVMADPANFLLKFARTLDMKSTAKKSDFLLNSPYAKIADHKDLEIKNAILESSLGGLINQYEKSEADKLSSFKDIQQIKQ